MQGYNGTNGLNGINGTSGVHLLSLFWTPYLCSLHLYNGSRELLNHCEGSQLCLPSGHHGCNHYRLYPQVSQELQASEDTQA